MFNRSFHALIVIGGVALALFLTWQFWPKSASEGEAVAGPEIQPKTTLVTLPEQKLRSAAIQIATVCESTIQPTRTLSGRLDYDQDRHIGIKSACDGILTQVLVRPGDQVTAGQVVAVVSSPEVGTARSTVHAKLADLRLVQARHQWQDSLYAGVEELVSLIREGKSPTEIEQRLKNEALGEYREKLVTAYTRSRLADQLASSSRDAAARGAISGRLQQQRESEQQASDAAIDAVLEQSLFEANQLCKESEAALEDAERQLEISLQQLNTLLGPAATKVSAEDMEKDRPSSLSEVNLVSPIDGTVEERSLSATERVAAGDSVFIVADTTHLWAVADVRERDWSAINVQVGQEVRLTTPAIPDETYVGRVLIVGRRLDPATGAASLVTAMDVADDRLRPGLFIRMTVPAGTPRTAVVVPESAVVVHEGKAFVFVPEGDRSFQRVDVEVGLTESGMTEITAGLKPGDKVAVAGVFKLKSELLLAGEGE